MKVAIAGAGKVGAENQTNPAEYQISQRADFFECLADLNTMVKRPIVNTRDEPHAEHGKYRRLHVIVGDANMAEPFLARGFSYEGVDGSAAMVDEARQSRIRLKNTPECLLLLLTHRVSPYLYQYRFAATLCNAHYHHLKRMNLRKSMH